MGSETPPKACQKGSALWRFWELDVTLSPVERWPLSARDRAVVTKLWTNIALTIHRNQVEAKLLWRSGPGQGSTNMMCSKHLFLHVCCSSCFLISAIYWLFANHAVHASKQLRASQSLMLLPYFLAGRRCHLVHLLADEMWNHTSNVYFCCTILS